MDVPVGFKTVSRDSRICKPTGQSSELLTYQLQCRVRFKRHRCCQHPKVPLRRRVGPAKFHWKSVCVFTSCCQVTRPWFQSFGEPGRPFADIKDSMTKQFWTSGSSCSWRRRPSCLSRWSRSSLDAMTDHNGQRFQLRHRNKEVYVKMTRPQAPVVQKSVEFPAH